MKEMEVSNMMTVFDQFARMCLRAYKRKNLAQ